MRIIFLILLGLNGLFAFELTLNTGRENNQAFAVLHAQNDKEFTCKQVFDDQKFHYECDILGIVNNKLQDQNLSYFDLKFLQQEKSIKMYIFPKIESRMYNFAQNIYADKRLSSANSSNSTAFTFIFANDLARIKKYNGLDFDIDFPHESLPYVGALDLNSAPVIIPQSADINTYLRIKDEFEKQNYSQVEIDTKNAIDRYKNSIFMNEFMLYKLRAQTQLYTKNPDSRNQQVLEQMIQDAKTWMRTFTSDKNFPEVLHIMLKTYIALSQSTNVDYILSILNKELPNNYYTELSRLDYADYIYDLNEQDRAKDIYENTYLNTKNLDLAARAAISLAKIALIQGQKEQAKNYINTLFDANPNYIGKDITRSLELAKLFYQNNEFNISSLLYQKIFNNMSKIDSRYESTLKDLALALSKSSKPSQAKPYLDLYMNDYLYGAYVNEIKKAADEVFFDLGDNNSTLLHARYKELMQNYKDKDEKIVNRALDEDIKLFYKENNLSAVLAYKNQIESSKLPNATKLLEQSAIKTLDSLINNDNCIDAVKIYEEFNTYEIGQKVEDKKRMLACLVRTSQIDDALVYINKNYNEDSIYYGLQKAQIDFDNKKYQETIDIANNIINTRILKSDDENFKAYYLRFLSYLKLGDYNNAIKTLKILETFPMSFTMVEGYDALVSYANDHNMQTTILTYAPKAIDYQNLKGVNLFSPNLEFTYLDVLAKTRQDNVALDVLKDLLKLKLTANDKARALYMQSEIYANMQNINAQKESLKQCLDINATSSWQDLCRQKNSLLGS